ncbi:MAG TPA: SUF system NifU family Fe-S cluster assembly protein [Burkholderiales bacterium]|nr:SUF system NifU family Fe-S cluster assembly protein [Burkholderiales bacterium]
MSEAKSLYNEAILDHIKNARNYRVADDATHKAHGINPLCGDTFDVFAKVEGDRIVDAAFQCECCGISMASASIMTEAVAGKTIEQAKALYRNLEKMLRDPQAGSGVEAGQLPVLELIKDFPSRVNCALLGWHTLDAALDGREETTLGG